jgi:hypothetical protein
VDILFFLSKKIPINFGKEKRICPQAYYTMDSAFEAIALYVHIIRKVMFDVVFSIEKDIQKRYLSKCYTKPRLKDLELIAIDEISIGKGHRYLTVVLDLLTGIVVFVGDGKGADALLPFWKRLKSSRAKIDAVAMDSLQPLSRLLRQTYQTPSLFLIIFILSKCSTTNLLLYAGICSVRQRRQISRCSREQGGF